MVTSLVVLAGGRGERIAEVRKGLPKALLPIAANLSLIELYALVCARHGIPMVVVAQEPDLSLIMEKLRANIPRGFVRAIADPGRGTGEAIRCALQRLPNGKVVIVNCDTLVPFNVVDILTRSQVADAPVIQHLTGFSNQAEGYIGVTPAGELSSVVYWGEVTGVRAPDGLDRMSSTGIYEIADPVRALELLPGAEVSWERETLPRLVQRGDLRAITHPAFLRVRDYGTVRSYRELGEARGELFALLERMGLANRKDA